MIDPSLMPELPTPRYEYFCTKCGSRGDCLSPPADIKQGCPCQQCNYTAFIVKCPSTDDGMRAYGLQCYQLAMERAADIAYDAAIRYSQGYAVDFKAEFALQEKTDGL